MAHTPEHAVLPPELEALVAGLGIDASGFVGAVETGPVVYMGTRRGTTMRGGVGLGRRPARSTVDDVMSVEAASALFYTLTDAELKDFQERAFAAGLYGTDDRSRVRFGDPTDGVTYNLWVDRVEAAAGFYNNGAGKKVTPWDALDLAARGQTGLGDDAGRERAPLTVELSNPADVKRLMSQAAKEALGSGKIDDARLDQIVAEWHAQQRQTQTAAYNTAETGGTVTGPMSFETFADQKAKETDPVAYDSYKMLDKFSQLVETFGGARA